MKAGTALSRRPGWISLLAGTVITSILGASYAYSAYKSSLMKLWGSSLWAALPFSVFVAVFALSSILGGGQYVRRGIRYTSLLSVALVFAGLALSSLVELISNPLYLVFTYGVLTGMGNGFGYIPVVTMARRWFPDRAGFATGVVIFGYGGSAAAFAPLKTMLVSAHGLATTFLVIGAVSLALGLPAALLTRDPSPEVTDFFSKRSKGRAVVPKEDIPPSRVLRLLDFWLLWVSFVLVSGAGLMLIGHLAPFAMLRGLGALEAAAAVSIFSVMNALGRPPAGWISDRLGRFGRPITMTALFAVQSALFASMAFAGYSAWELYMLVALAGFVYGSALALYPAAVGDFFGLKYLSTNYSLVFTGWGLAGLVFPSLGGYIRDLTGGYEQALLVFGGASFVGSLMCLYLKTRLKRYLP